FFTLLHAILFISLRWRRNVRRLARPGLNGRRAKLAPVTHARALEQPGDRGTLPGMCTRPAPGEAAGAESGSIPAATGRTSRRDARPSATRARAPTARRASGAFTHDGGTRATPARATPCVAAPSRWPARWAGAVGCG